MTLEINATYSAEDNKLRLYASDRLDAELFERVKEMGFRWAPKQGLFVAPRWTPGREDFCIELAKEITAEGTTMAERAEAKIERLNALSEKRDGQARSFQSAANCISGRIADGQPILIGHHSERRARKDRERMESAQKSALKAADAVDYWNYKAAGVACHANRKSAARVVKRRIKTLLAELRSHQRDINHANLCREMWEAMPAKAGETDYPALVERMAGGVIGTGPLAPKPKEGSYWSMLGKGEITAAEVVEKCRSHFSYLSESPYRFRWIQHTLNRLAYERGEMGDVPRFEGEITPVILQAFAREHGADKPKATATENGFKLGSIVALPLHIADGKETTLALEEWRDLMQAAGYQAEIKARKAPKKQASPLINPSLEEARKLQELWNLCRREKTYTGATDHEETSQESYSRHSQGDYGRYRTISIDASGKRIWGGFAEREEKPVPVCRVRVGSGGQLYSADSVVILTDKPSKALPLDLDTLLSAAKKVHA
tara:strand:- start:16325 stop:17797 length:1473 start_codon:yes stop_codon:yes gene_type:complete